MDLDQLETESKAVFKNLPEVEAPFLGPRVLARLAERRKNQKQVRVWQWLTAVSCMVAICFLTLHFMDRGVGSNQAANLFAFEPYVIHVNLDENEMKLAASAEVELPSGVSFVSKDDDIKALRSLKLPVSAVQGGRSRLPFVVQSDRTGTLPLQVKIFDSHDVLIQTKVITLHFVERT